MILTQTAIPTLNTPLRLTSQLKYRLMQALQAYVSLQAQAKLIDESKRVQLSTIQDIHAELGVGTLEVEGFKSTFVAPVRRILDKKRFVALGGDLALLEQAMVDQPGTSYVKVTPPHWSPEVQEHDE